MKFLMKQAITAKLKLELSDRQQQLSQTTNNSDNSTRIRKIGGGRKYVSETDTTIDLLKK